jgi:hypothetical protein
VAEIPNLGLLSLGGYRAVQLGHFSSAILGAYAFTEVARHSRLPKPSLFGLVYLFTPIVAKQMSTNYVDMAFYSYWLACAACVARIAVLPMDRPKFADWSFFGMSAFLLVGAKMNGFVSLLALAPLVCLAKLAERRGRFLSGLAIVAGFSLLSASFWMIPNWRAWRNPIFPLQPSALLPKSGLQIVPPEIPLTELSGWVGTLDVPEIVRWLLQFFIFEPIAQYDMCGGAWGFVGLWSIVALLTVVLRNDGFRKPRWKFPPVSLVSAFYVCMLLSFIITPGRITPRYAILGGFLFIFPAMVLLLNGHLPRVFTLAFPIALLLNVPYTAFERVLFRGTWPISMSRFSGIVGENFLDIVKFGEPQNSERWMHFPYVPALRKQEPREVIVGSECVDLLALYWGRRYENRVEIRPECCRWPYRCE